MSSCRQLMKHFCPKCDEVMIFNAAGCCHCGMPLIPGAPVHVPSEYDKRIVLAGRKPGACGLEALTGREKKILALLGSGSSAGTIARMLCMTEAAMRPHRYRICSKLGLKFRAGTDVLRNYAQAKGLERAPRQKRRAAA